jgi:integrase
MNLTAKAVAALVLPSDKNDDIHFDDQLAGFGYRLRRRTSDGPVRRTWVAQYRRAGATRRVKLGDAGALGAEQARAAAKKVLAAVALGQDPQADRVDRREKDKLGFRSVVEQYLAVKQTAVRRHSLIETKRYLTGNYFKPLHSMAIDTITRKDIAARLIVIARGGTVAAARARATIAAFFVWCLQMGLVESNPCIGVVKPKDTEGRSRVLGDAELAALWRAGADDRLGEFGRIVRLLILLPCRRQEIGGMRWSELDAERGTWTLPSERSKNGKAHTLPLPPIAWDIINSVPRRASRDHLFGLVADRGFTHWALKSDLDKRLGAAVAPFVLHDLRRSVATRMADLGVQPHIIEQILNHQSGHKAGPAGIYNRSSYEREVRTAVAMWADHVRALAEGGDRKVLAFNAAPVPAS